MHVCVRESMHACMCVCVCTCMRVRECMHACVYVRAECSGSWLVTSCRSFVDWWARRLHQPADFNSYLLTYMHAPAYLMPQLRRLGSRWHELADFVRAAAARAFFSSAQALEVS